MSLLRSIPFVAILILSVVSQPIEQQEQELGQCGTLDGTCNLSSQNHDPSQQYIPSSFVPFLARLSSQLQQLRHLQENHPQHLLTPEAAQLTNPPLKFAIFQKHQFATGWGNRLRAMLGIFLFGLLTDRVILLEHQMLEDNFLSPFVVDVNGHPEYFPWHYIGQQLSAEALNATSFVQSFCASQPQLRVFYEDFTFIKTGDLISRYESTSCIFYDQPYSWDHHISLNPNHREAVSALFKTPSRLHRLKEMLGFLLSRPSPAINQAVQELLLRIGLSDSISSDVSSRPYRLGIQLRLFNDLPSHSRHISEIGFYWSCARQIVSDLHKELQQNHTNCLQQKASTNEDNAVPPECEPPKLVIFFTSDTAEMKDAAIKELSEYGRVVFSDQALVHTSNIDQRGFNSALIEWMALGECDSVLVNGSSFGVLAFGRNSTTAHHKHPQRLYHAPLQSWGGFRHCGQMPAVADAHWGQPEHNIRYDY